MVCCVTAHSVTRAFFTFRVSFPQTDTSSVPGSSAEQQFLSLYAKLRVQLTRVLWRPAISCDWTGELVTCLLLNLKLFVYCIKIRFLPQRKFMGEIKSWLKSGNACYQPVQNLPSSSLLSKYINIKIHRTVILPVLLYGCETWSLTLREEHRQKMFENGVLRKTFRPKRDEATGEYRKLHNKELYNLCFLPNIIRLIKWRRMRWARHVARRGDRRGVYGVLVGRP